MMNSPRLLLLHALTPIHCGTGQAIGGIELPIAREHSTGIPLVPGSSLKGVLRAAPQRDGELCRAAFGPPNLEAAAHAGALQFSDLRLTVLPVRSLRGTFAWCTSPYLLTRFRRDAAEAGLALPAMPPAPQDENEVLVASDPKILDGSRLILEEFDFEAKKRTDVGALGKWFAEKVINSPVDEVSAFAARFAVLPDDVMISLLETGMEITSHNRLDPVTKTVVDGALWTEESLPVESVLSGLVACTPVSTKRDKQFTPANLLDLVGSLTERALQVGGNASVGRGVCRIHVLGGE